MASGQNGVTNKEEGLAANGQPLLFSWWVRAGPFGELRPGSPSTLGVSVDHWKQANPHYFYIVIYQALTGAIFGLVGFCWVILGTDGYTLATVTAGEIEQPSTLPEVENIGFRMQLVTFQKIRNKYY